MLYLRLLGSFAADVDGEKLKLPTSPRTLSLWAYLLLNSATPVRRELLAPLLWPDESEATARARLRHTLHQLQSALPTTLYRPWLLVTPIAIQWNAAADYWLDTMEFERLLSMPDQRAAAVALYTGELLPGCYDDWVIAPRERLRELYADALGGLVEEYRARLDYRQAAIYARQLLTHDPLSDVGLRQLVAILYQMGDRAAAIAEYERFVLRLREELGVEPMPETRQLYEAVLHQRPLLSPDVPPPPPLAQTSPPGVTLLPLVGRTQELAQLERVWHEAARGNGGLALVAGEAGIGKSRLTWELANKAAQGAARALRGRATYAEPTPYQALVTALRPALPLLAALENPAPLRAVLPLLPELAQRRTDLMLMPPIEPERERQRLYQGLAECLSQLATPRPLLLILEDLHWAGSATIELLSYLAQRLSGQRVLIVGTYREDETSRGHPLRELRRLVTQAQRERYLPLTRLDKAAVAALSGQIPDLAARGKAMVEQLYQESEGNPFFLSELIREWREQPATAESRRQLAGGAASLISSRLARLEPNPRLLAEVASVSGVAFNLELLAEVTGWDEGTLLNTLDELLDKGLVREAGSAQGYDYSFSHHLVQEAIYAQMSAEVRSRRHRRLALVMEEMYPPQLGTMASELARHFDLGSEPDRAVPYYLTAARRALAVYADEEALAATMRAQELASEPRLQFEALALSEGIYHRLGSREPQRDALETMAGIATDLADANLVCETLRRRIIFCHVLGEPAQEATLVAELTRCAASIANPRWQALALQMAAHLQSTDQPAAAQRSVTEALSLYQQLRDRDAQVECYCKLANIALHRGEFAQAQDWIDHATRLTSSANARLLVRALREAYIASSIRGESQTAYSICMQMLDIYRLLNDREGEADTHAYLVHTAGEMMRIEEALAHFQQAREIFAAIGKRRGEAGVMLNVAVMMGDYGRSTEALTLLGEAETIFASLGDLKSQAACIANRSTYCIDMGDCLSAYHEALRGLTLIGPLQSRYLQSALLANLGISQLRLGEHEAAIRHLQAALHLSREIGRSSANAYLLSELTIAYLQTADLAAAQNSCAAALEVYQSDAAEIQIPQKVLWVAACLNHAISEVRVAHDYLSTAYTLIQEQLAILPDATWRDAYLQLPDNRYILAAYEHGEWPAYAMPRPTAASDVPSSPTPACPTCGKHDVVVKAGLGRSGGQRYRCKLCQRYFIAQTRSRGYALELRQRALALHQSGMGMRAIAREMGVNPQTISNWLAVTSPPEDKA